MDLPTVSIEFNVTRAEKTVAWFYSGVKQPRYQKARVSMFDVLPNGVEAHRMSRKMLFKCRDWYDSVVMFSSIGAISLRIDDEYGWPNQGR
jgi:hypothetical protein